MDFIFDAIEAWIIKLLASSITNNMENMFESINVNVKDIATQVGMTPSVWNGGVFSMIRNLSDTVIMPIAGMVLTFVMCYELIQMIIDRNNLHDFTASDIFRWMMKTFIAVMIISNTFPIIMGIFDVAQSVIDNASGLIVSDTLIDATQFEEFEDFLETQELGYLIGLFIQMQLIDVGMRILGLLIFIIIHGRMIEIYLVTSLGAIPLSTMTCKEWNIGQNYIKSVIALAFQAFLIMVCIAIYAVLIQSVVLDGDPINSIWTCVGYTVLLCFILFKTGTLSKQIFSAH